MTLKQKLEMFDFFEQMDKKIEAKKMRQKEIVRIKGSLSSQKSRTPKKEAL